MDDAQRLMTDQCGLVHRRELIARGWAVDDVNRRVARGEWVAVRRGVYASGALWESLEHPDDRDRLRALAASRSMLNPHVVSHDSAALLTDLPLLPDARRIAHITRLGGLGGRTRHGVKHHQAPFAPWMILERSGVPCFDRARTAADLAREHGLRQGLVAVDAALRLGTRAEDLHEVVDRMRCWPQVRTVREAVLLGDRGAESPGETLLRLLLLEAGVATRTQTGFREGRREAWVDLRVRRHLIEFDGRGKYGLDGPDAGRSLWEEKQREDWLRSFHLGVSRAGWDDVLPQNWRRTQVRLLAEIARTDELYGAHLGDLAGVLLPDPVREARLDRARRPL